MRRSDATLSEAKNDNLLLGDFFGTSIGSLQRNSQCLSGITSKDSACRAFLFVRMYNVVLYSTVSVCDCVIMRRAFCDVQEFLPGLVLGGNLY